MAKRIYFLVIALLVPTCVILMLFNQTKQNSNRNGGFKRLFKQNVLIPISKFTLAKNNFYIAGIIGRQVFLARPAQPGDLYKTTIDQAGLQRIQLDNAGFPSANIGLELRVDSPFIYQIENSTRTILRRTISSPYFSQLKILITNFSTVMPLSFSSFIFKKFDTSIKQNILEKISISQPQQGKYILEKQGEGRFSVDGIMLSDQSKNNLVYVYFYRNLFICLDSNLSKNYRSNTIDTTSIAKVKISQNQSARTSTLSIPPPFVNRKACLNDHYLFINSAIRADNEKESFDDSSVIDGYSLSTGHYQGSFYIPGVANGRIGSICATNNQLVVINSNVIAVYNLEFQ